MKQILIAIITSLLVLSCNQTHKTPPTTNFVDINVPTQLLNPEDEAAIKKQVTQIIANMPLEEKIAQLQGAWLRDLVVDGKLSIEKCKEKIPHGIGHLAQFSSSIGLDPDELKKLVFDLQNYLKNNTTSKIPAIFHEEAISGFSARGATTLPQQIGMGCTWNPALLSANTTSSAKLMRLVGATQALSPMLDICRDPHWGRIEESFGEEPYLTARMGLAFMRGLQGDDLNTGVAGTTKHFAGYAGGTDNSNVFYEETLLPHEVAVRIGNAQSAMAGYHEVHGVPCSASKELLTDILRKKWGFDGVVVSDFWSVNQVFTKFKYAKDQKEAATKSIQAGLDVELPKGAAFPFLGTALKEGSLSKKTLEQALERVLTLKARLGLLQQETQQYSDEALDFDPIENRERAYQSAVQSIVLLKNDGVLPIKKSYKNIAVVGPNADAVQSLLGDYTYQSLSAYWWKLPTDPENPKLVTLLEGLKSKVDENTKIRYARGCDWTKSLQNEITKVDTTVGDARIKDVKYLNFKDLPTPNIEEALQIASESDVIIAAMGEHLYLSGEGRDRKDIRLPGDQEAFIKKLATTNKPIVLVMFGGRPQIVTDIEPVCSAIVQAWFPGEEGGNAVADIILGNANPSGKLTLTVPKTNAQTPIWYRKGYDKNNMPMYPFGFGLSYTSYTYSKFQFPVNANIQEDWITLSFDLENTGAMDGTEIVQLYVVPKNAATKIAPIELKGFGRVDVAKGGKKRVTFKVSPEQLSYYKDGKFSIEPGNYDFLIGASSTDIRLRANINIIGDKKEMTLRSKYFSNIIIH